MRLGLKQGKQAADVLAAGGLLCAPMWLSVHEALLPLAGVGL